MRFHGVAPGTHGSSNLQNAAATEVPKTGETENKEQAQKGETSTSKMKDADHCDSEQRASGTQAKNSLEKIPAGEMSKTEETDSVAVEKEKQNLASFYQKLLQKGPKKGKIIISHKQRHSLYRFVHFV